MIIKSRACQQTRPRVTCFLLILSLSGFCRAAEWDAFDPKVNPFPPTAQFARLFGVRELEEPPIGEGPSLTSFLFVPKTLDKSKKYPLIVWLHGMGQIELEQPLGPLNWLSELIFTESPQAGRYEFFVWAPHCKDAGGWTRGGYLLRAREQARQDVSPCILERQLTHLVNEYPIDAGRISMVGISAGAGAAGRWAYLDPERFSAVAMMAGGEAAENLSPPSQTVFWQFVNRDDVDYPLSMGLDLVAQINDKGGQAYVTVFPTGGHNVWNRAFLGEHQLLCWLLEKSRDDPSGAAVLAEPYTVRMTGERLKTYRPPGDPLSVRWKRLVSVAASNSASLVGGVVVLSVLLLVRITLRKLHLKPFP